MTERGIWLTSCVCEEGHMSIGTATPPPVWQGRLSSKAATQGAVNRFAFPKDNEAHYVAPGHGCTPSFPEPLPAHSLAALFS